MTDSKTDTERAREIVHKLIRLNLGTTMDCGGHGEGDQYHSFTCNEIARLIAPAIHQARHSAFREAAEEVQKRADGFEPWEDEHGPLAALASKLRARAGKEG